jgi:hypothetical protein
VAGIGGVVIRLFLIPAIVAISQTRLEARHRPHTLIHSSAMMIHFSALAFLGAHKFVKFVKLMLNFLLNRCENSYVGQLSSMEPGSENKANQKIAMEA